MASELAEEEGLVFHPMDQFKIHPLFGDGPIHWYTPTNATLWMGIAILCIIAFQAFGGAISGKVGEHTGKIQGL